MRVENVNILDLTRNSQGIERTDEDTAKVGDSSVFRIEKDEQKSVFGDATYQKPQGKDGADALSDIQNQAGMTTATQMKNEMVVAANSTTPKDVQETNEDGFSIYDTKLETVVTETDKMKIRMAKDGQDVSYFGDDVSAQQIEEVAGSAAVAEQIAGEFAKANLPMTEDNQKDTTETIAMAEELKNPSDGAIKYMLDNELEPTVENLYKAEFSGSASYTAGQTDMDYTGMRAQMEQVIAQAGLPVNEETMADSQWLLENDIPLTAENLTYLQELQNLSLPMSTEAVAKAAVAAVQEGSRPQQAMLIEGYSAADQAQHTVDVIEQATDEELKLVLENNWELTVENIEKAHNILAGTQAGANAADASGIEGGAGAANVSGTQAGVTAANAQVTDIDLITARRQLEEVRLAMTAEANYALLKQGISIDTKPLAELVDALKAQEDSYYANLLTQDGIEATAENIASFKNTTDTVEALKDMPAATLGIPQADTETLAGLAEEGARLKDEYVKAGASYETMMTRPRADMGDSIQTAFQNVDAILEDLGLDTNQANQRAVRILAYNNIEITPENITAMKAADEEVQQTFKNLTPAVVREMIKEGENPLDMTIEELNQKAVEIKEDLGTEEEMRFSKYLYQLEQNQEISEEERSAYIGVYRLIHQVEKTDGAAIGSLMQQGAEVTMRNLLTQVRSSRHSNRDYTVDDDFEGVGAVETDALSITEQIEAGYQQNRLADALDELTPDKLHQLMENGDWQELTPEQLAEQLAQLDDKEEAAQAYEQQQLADMAKSATSSEEVYQMLADYDIPVTVGNVLAAQEMMNNRNGAFKQFFDTTKTGQQQAETSDIDLAAIKEQLLEEFGEAVKTPEDMARAQQKLAETAEHVMRDMIISSEDVTTLDIRAMKMMTTQFTMGSDMAKEENYAIPVLVQGETTNVSLKIVRGTEKKGLIDVVFETAGLGKVAAQLKADKSGISGYIAADSRETADLFGENADSLITALRSTPTEEGEEQQVDISFVVSDRLNLQDFGGSDKSIATEDGEARQLQTKTLYHMAESFIKTVKGLG